MASALLFLQETVQSNAAHLTVLSTAATRAPPALRSLSTVQLRINVTIAGSDAASELACADEDTECALYIGGTLMANSGVSGRSGRSTRVRLVDVTFRGGRGNYGGALFASAASVSLERVRIVNAFASRAGGGIFARDSDLTLIDCDLEGNGAALYGGAVALLNSDMQVRGGGFCNNSVSALPSVAPLVNRSVTQLYGQGGAIVSVSSAVRLDSVRFAGNAARIGGALAAAAFSTVIAGVAGAEHTAVIAVNCSFTDNVAIDDGGAVYLAMMLPQPISVYDLERELGTSTLLTARTDAINGIGALTGSASPVQLLQCSFIGNAAGGRGGAVALQDSFLFSRNSSFVHNSAVVAGGAVSWQPSQSDEAVTWGTPPVMQGTLTSSEWMGSCAAFVGDTGAVDALCNSAGYGAFVSSPAASLRLLPSSYASALQPQMSGTVITPPISVELIDVYGQRVSSDSTTFVALGPSTQLTGATSVRVTRGSPCSNNLCCGHRRTSACRCSSLRRARCPRWRKTWPPDGCS
jgi:hypothetical protein